MLRRLLIVLVPLAFLLVAALGVPLGTAVAQRETQEVYVDRLNDVGRFASLAETALSSGRTESLQSELRRYEELYGIPAALVDPAGQVVLASSSDVSDSWAMSPATSGVLSQALAGYRPEPPTVLWPWGDEPLVIAEPVGRDSEVVGVVLAVSDTGRLRSSVLSSWGWMAMLGLLPLAALTAVAWPVSWWVLRPVRRLDDATAAIADGDLSVRAGSAGGPPELRRLASSFNAMVDVVQRALDRQRAFVADASHQLRNPLASLRLAVENLSPHLTTQAAQDAHVVAVDEAKAMNRMLNSLLATTRIESIKNAEPVELDTVIETREQRWRALAGQSGMVVELDVAAGVVVLEPPGGLGSVLDELMSNAWRLSGGSRVELRSVRSGPPNVPARPGPAGRAGSAGYVELWLRDDGTGLDPDERSAAPGRFWRSPRHQNVTGTGLGLAICAELVEAAGGNLRLEDGLVRADGGCGLGVVLRLPVA